jgi:magnesium transporter
MEMQKIISSEEGGFKPKTAGKLMGVGFPKITQSHTIGDARVLVSSKVQSFASIDYIFVVDRQNKLEGVISIKELFRFSESKKIGEIMTKKITTIRASTDQERIAYTALKHNLKSLPVVDKDGVLLGIVSSDTILKTLYHEMQEDILRFAGVHRKESIDNVMEMPVWTLYKHRIPWLLIGTIGGLLASGVINYFDQTLEENLILASFIPLVVYVASAVSMQMSVILIRDFAINPKLDFFKYCLKQFSVVLLIGLSTSAILFLYSWLAHNDLPVGWVLAVALFASNLSAILTGLAVPFLFSKLKSDPANASGPIATIIQDLLSIAIYFIIASVLL